MPLHVCRGRLVAFEAQHRRRLPELHHEHHDDDAGERAQDVGELRPDVVGDVELDGGKGQSARDNCRQHLNCASRARHDHDQVPRDDDGDQGAQPADHRADGEDRQAGDVGERRDRDADRAKSHRRGVGKQADAGGVEGREAEPGQHRSRDRNRRAEPGRPFDERAEGEGDEHRLEAAIVGQSADRVLDDLELAGVDRQSVQHDRGEDDPRDGKQPVGGAVERRHHGELDGHAVDDERHEQRRAERRRGRHPRRLAQRAQHHEQHDDGNRRENGRQAEAAADRDVAVFPHKIRSPDRGPRGRLSENGASGFPSAAASIYEMTDLGRAG